MKRQLINESLESLSGNGISHSFLQVKRGIDFTDIGIVRIRTIPSSFSISVNSV